MSAPTVFRGREVEMTEEDLAAEAASFAGKHDDDSGDTTDSAINDGISSPDDDNDDEEIPIIKSDIVSSPAGVNPGILPMAGSDSSRCAESKGKRKFVYPKMGSFASKKKARTADNSSEDFPVASSADSQPNERAHVTFRTASESPTPIPRKTRAVAGAKKSTRASAATSAQSSAPVGKIKRSSSAPETDSETDDPGSKEVDEPELKAAPRRGRPRKTEGRDVNKTITQGRKRGRPPKMQGPAPSEQSAKDNAKESRRSLRSLGKKGDDDKQSDENKKSDDGKKAPTTHGRGVGRVKKASTKRRPSGSTSAGEEYEVERIVDTKIDDKTKEQLYMVKWKGYSSKDNTWELKKNLNCDKLLKAFHDKHARSAK